MHHRRADHFASSTLKSARSSASQSRHHAPWELNGSFARSVLSDIEKRSPSIRIGEWPYLPRAFLDDAAVGLLGGKYLPSREPSTCAGERISSQSACESCA